MIDRATLARDLVALGVPRGGLVMVHASMRRVGPIDGGADALLDALHDVLGPEGTMMMALGATDDRPFDNAGGRLRRPCERLRPGGRDLPFLTSTP